MAWKSKQHQFYVYHDENRVMARMDDLEPVVAMECEPAVVSETVEGKTVKVTASANQVAHDEVQKIVNPHGKRPEDFKQTDKLGRALGFHSDEFQSAIAGNCAAFVKAAYAKAKKG